MQGIVDKIKKSAERDIPKIVGKQKQDIIEAGGEHNGRAAWAPNKPETVRKKGHDQIWVDSGDVYETIVSGNIDALPEYAEYVDKGTKDGKIPPRPLLDYTERDMEEITQEFKKVLERELTG